ncbi:MAG: phosphate signaling complex protein PhoU [FCB group bacterium]|nr:phosphate signaling complex protein PhoU [FCB group bacterium]
MPSHLHREIESLKRSIVEVGTRVEEALRESVDALKTRNDIQAQAVINGDERIDQLEVQVEEECLKVMALYQPVAIDLRYIISVLKINNDLERIGDLASNVAERVVYLTSRPPLEIPDAIPEMGHLVQEMLGKALDALVSVNPETARDVLEMDNRVDQLHRNMFTVVEQEMLATPERISDWIQVLGVSRYLERSADHCTNIAEDILYMVEGEIHRHQSFVE